METESRDTERLVWHVAVAAILLMTALNGWRAKVIADSHANEIHTLQRECKQLRTQLDYMRDREADRVTLEWLIEQDGKRGRTWLD